MSKTAIIILTYKDALNEFEQISLESLLRVFVGKKDIYVAVPEKLNTKIYEEKGLAVVRFDDVWFSSYKKYNEFCLQPLLYERFVDYEYILFYQLDGFTFYDELDYFCNLGFDYIGAPWDLGNFWYKNQHETIWYVGCGGVSLRNVKAFIKLTEDEEMRKAVVYEPEDMLIASAYDRINIAPVDIAKRFCVTQFYEPLDGELPMFLHWFDHMEEESYREAIKRQGYKLPDKPLFQVEWNKEARLRITEYWQNQFNLQKVKKYVEEYLGKRISECYVWGTGNNALICTKMFLEMGISISAYIDNDERKRSSLFFGKKVLSCDEIPERGAFIFVSPNVADSIELQLYNRGYVKDEDFILWKDFVSATGLYKGGLGQ